MQAKTGSLKRLAAVSLPGGMAMSEPLELTHEFLADNHVVGFDNLADRAHPFIALRSKLMKHVRETGQRVFAVTSVQPGNGKTHVGVNLAAVLSRIAPTKLIELDLRKPTIGARLGLDRPAIGIDDFLDGNARWQDSAQQITGFDLTVHRVRQPRGDAGTLLGSLRTRHLFEAIRALPDTPICIIDTPPVFIDDDFMLVAPGLDGVLMVVEEGRTTRRALRDTVDALKPTPVLGTVLNKSISSAATRIDYGYYHYADAPPRGWQQRARAVWNRIRP